jgi:hypothetical protein
MSIAERPAPSQSQADPDYDLRMQWRRSLSDADVRSMAYEYRVQEAALEKVRKAAKQGIRLDPVEIDPTLTDAWLEYEVRFSSTKPKSEFVKKASAIKSRRKRR